MPRPSFAKDGDWIMCNAPPPYLEPVFEKPNSFNLHNCRAWGLHRNIDFNWFVSIPFLLFINLGSYRRDIYGLIFQFNVWVAQFNDPCHEMILSWKKIGLWEIINLVQTAIPIGKKWNSLKATFTEWTLLQRVCIII